MQIGDKIYYAKTVPYSGKTEYIDENGHKWARLRPYPTEYKVFELELKTIVRVSFEGPPIDENLASSLGESYLDYMDKYFFASDDGETKYLIYQEDMVKLEKNNKHVSCVFRSKEEAEKYANEATEINRSYQ